jgi:RNA polymerase sigma-70 factor (ECF subfamily)
MLPQIPIDQETQLVERALAGDNAALTALVEPLRKPVFSYIYRLVTERQDAEDLLQDVLVRVLESLPSFRGEARFKTWLFGIATHACLDHLRHKKRWRVDAQLEGEREADQNPEQLEKLSDVMARPDFVFEIREHISFCFSCVSRTLPPEEQAALMLREVLGFSNQEAAGIMEISEPVFRHRLSSARGKMIQSYDGLCQLINKTGVCYQCRGLREVAREQKQGPDLVQIEVAPGLSVTPQNLFDARLNIVRETDFTEGSMRAMHDWFFEGINRREENRE